MAYKYLHPHYINGPNRNLEKKLDDYPWVDPKLVLSRKGKKETTEIIITNY